MRFCPTCGKDNGCPNVRQAAAERTDLRKRLILAEEDAKARSCVSQLRLLRRLVRSSVAVIATTPNKAHALLRDPAESYVSFYRLIASGARGPKSNWFDQVRGIADELLFPNYREYISFAALSLTGVGSRYYGSVHLVLADFAIRHRASAFEENSVYFCHKRKLGVHNPLPPGYRALWKERDRLAGAKLGRVLHSSMSPDDVSTLLLGPPDDPDADFIEVHVFERLNRSSIQRVLVGEGGSEDDEIMKALVVRDCQREGIPYEELR